MKPRYQVGATLPATMGRCADLYAEVRELRLAMQKATDEMKARETEIREHIIRNLEKSADSGAAGQRYRAQIVTKVTPTVADWSKVHAFVLEHNRFDLLQKRISDKAVKDLWEEGQNVPGVERFNAVDVSITKI